MHAPQPQLSNNMPLLQQGAAMFSGSEPARHRKAVSLGTSALSSNYSSFSPHLGAMMEDAEDVGGSTEEGEISDNYFPGHQARSQSQSFMAPRFAALAAQQEQDSLGPSGRPQLAPNFMFGARRRTSSNVPLGPPINEEDVGFQFPQQQQNFAPDNASHDLAHRKPDGDITGIMAEQVRGMLCMIMHSDLAVSTDCHPEPDRGPSTAAAGTLSTAIGLEPGFLHADPWPGA